MRRAHEDLLAAEAALRQPGALAGETERREWRLWLGRVARLLHQAGAISFGAASLLFEEGAGYTAAGRTAMNPSAAVRGTRVAVEG